MASIINSGGMAPLGLHGGCLNNMDSSDSKKMNIMLALSWIPIIGAIVGAFKAYVGYQGYKEESQSHFPDSDELAFYRGFMIRGGAEVLTLGCIGPIMFVLDMIVTLGRVCTEDVHYDVI